MSRQAWKWVAGLGLVVLIVVSRFACEALSSEILSIFGDPQSVGAQVLIDGRSVGRIAAWKDYDGPVVVDSSRRVLALPCLSARDSVIRSGEHLGVLHVHPHPGRYRLTLIDSRGDTLSLNVRVIEYATVYVSFRCRTIVQTE